MSTPPTAAPPEQERPEITRAPFTAAFIGWLAGMLSAFFGIGGGLLIVPGLALHLRIRQARAVGTSLAVMLPVAVAGAMRYHQEALERSVPGLNPWEIVWLAVGSVFGAAFAAPWVRALNLRRFRRFFGVLVIAAGMWLIITYRVQFPDAVSGSMDAARSMQMLGVGLLVGAIGALVGAGGGMVLVPALALFLGYPQQHAQGTSLAVVVPVSLSGALIHLLRGNIVWSLAVWLAIGGVVGAWTAAGWVYRIDAGVLRILFGALIIAGGVSLASGRQAEPEKAEQKTE